MWVEKFGLLDQISGVENLQVSCRCLGRNLGVSLVCGEGDGQLVLCRSACRSVEYLCVLYGRVLASTGYAAILNAVKDSDSLAVVPERVVLTSVPNEFWKQSFPNVLPPQPFPNVLSPQLFPNVFQEQPFPNVLR